MIAATRSRIVGWGLGLALMAAACSSPPEPFTPFECGRELDRGFERLREVARDGRVSILHVETNYWGGASGGMFFGWMCLSQLCQQRGCSAFVILDHHMIRNGDDETRGNDWEVVVGFLDSTSQDVALTFPDYPRGDRDHRVWPLLVEGESMDFATSVVDAMHSDLWEVFSSLHFHFRSPAKAPEDPPSGGG